MEPQKKGMATPVNNAIILRIQIVKRDGMSDKALKRLCHKLSHAAGKNADVDVICRAPELFISNYEQPTKISRR